MALDTRFRGSRLSRVGAKLREMPERLIEAILGQRGDVAVSHAVRRSPHLRDSSKGKFR